MINIIALIIKII